MGHRDISSTYMGTFNLVMFKVISGSFGALVLKWPVTPKWLVVDGKD